MQQTLLSRWEGALLGSCLPWMENVSEGAQVESWYERQSQTIQALAETGQWQGGINWKGYTTSEIILSCLPLILFFNDQPETWGEQLSAIAQQKNESSLATAAILAYATAITWGTSEKLRGNTLFKKLRKDLDEDSSCNVLIMLQNSLEQEATLQEIKLKLPSTCQDIWLALYCFATTSENLALSVRRVKTSEGSNSIILALLGALSGVHNGVNAIPVSWRCLLQKERTEWKQKLRLMWATWSGNYHFPGRANLDEHLDVNAMAIAPCGVIQPRRQKP